jgi:hypothetical protein
VESVGRPAPVRPPSRDARQGDFPETPLRLSTGPPAKEVVAHRSIRKWRGGLRFRLPRRTTGQSRKGRRECRHGHQAKGGGRKASTVPAARERQALIAGSVAEAERREVGQKEYPSDLVATPDFGP